MDENVGMPMDGMVVYGDEHQPNPWIETAQNEP